MAVDFKKNAAAVQSLEIPTAGLERLYDRNVRIFAFIFAVGGLLMLAGDALFGFTGNTLFEASVVAMIFVCLFLSFSRRLVRVVAFALPTLLVVGVSLAFCFGSGIHDPGSPAFVLVILIAAFFMGSTGAIVFTLLSALAAAVVVVAEIAGLYHTAYGTTVGTIVTFDVVVLISGTLLWLITRSLERAIASAKAAQDELRRLNTELEQRVAERTVALRRTQDELVRSEKMAALGKLMAGIAHEMNSPLGAIQSSASSAGSLVGRAIEDMVLFSCRAEGENTNALRNLVHVASDTAQRPLMLTTSEERAVAKAASREFAALGMEQAAADQAALAAARIGNPDIVDAVHPFMAEGRALPALRAAEATSALAAGIATIALSAERLSKIAFALRGYTHVVEDEPFREIAVTDSLDQALSLFVDPFRHGVTLLKHYDYSGPVYCRPGPLGQLWVNLIQNAVYAMSGIGRLEIRTSRDQNRIRIAVVDSGPGIPPEIQPRIFEPFFTTKRLGEGTGLGLDISRRIVEEHEGSITFESAPGRTSFEIELPDPGCAPHDHKEYRHEE